MMDQKQKFSTSGIRTEFICYKQKDVKVVNDVLNGLVQLVFISPESIVGNHKYRKMLATSAYQSKLVAIADCSG